ncbi:MAG: hypothetical protein HY021_15675 [Burkholderiales bacterium]|nr:hypothetical protein [Burkholderiales bacterium]
MIQTFYAVSPLRHAFDPRFSDKTRLCGISWQTVQIEPWQPFNSAHEAIGSFDGWHVLLMQVDAAQVRMFVDGRELVRHGGRNVPVAPMAISFSLWFSPAGTARIDTVPAAVPAAVPALDSCCDF